jgi:hypothetical protein
VKKHNFDQVNFGQPTPCPFLLYDLINDLKVVNKNVIIGYFLSKLVQQAPLNVISLRLRETNNINLMIALTKQPLCLIACKKSKWALEILKQLF